MADRPSGKHFAVPAALAMIVVIIAIIPPVTAGALEFANPFRLGHRYPLSGEPRALATGDFNGDGFDDVVVGEAGGEVAVFLADPLGRLVRAGSIARIAMSLVTADFDGDLRIDVAGTAYSDTGSVFLCVGNGDGTFEAPKLFPTGGSPYRVAAGDLNRDGLSDLVVTAWPSSIRVLLNTGAGFSASASYPCGLAPLRSVIADFDRDGWPDVAVVREDCRCVSVMRNLGGGSLDALREFPTYGYGFSIATADFSGDGAPDLVTVGHGGHAEVLTNDGHGDFLATTVTWARAGRSDIFDVVASDFDHDGIPDFAFTEGHGLFNAAWVVVAHKRGDGSNWDVAPYWLGLTWGDGGLVAAGDVDADGKRDLLVAGKFGSIYSESIRNLTVFRHLSSRRLNGLEEYPDTVDAAVVHSLQLTDGDLAIMTRRGWIRRVAADGGLLPAERSELTDSASIADWDGDGFKDIALPHGPTLEVQFATGAPIVLPRVASPDDVLGMGDFDSDGQADVLLQTAPGLAVAFRDGDGFASPMPIVDDEGSPILADVAVPIPRLPTGTCRLAISREQDSVLVLEPVARGVFKRVEAIGHPSAWLPVRQLLVTDLDADGEPDVVVIHSASGSSGFCWVMKGVGSGEFLPLQQEYALPSEAPVAGVTDFNADGLPDLVAISPGDGLIATSFRVLVGRGDDTFVSTNNAETLEHVIESISIADLNHDSRPDLVFGFPGYPYQGYGGGVSVLLNQLRGPTLTAVRPTRAPAQLGPSISLAGPNPSHRQLLIRLALNSLEPARIDVIDVGGRRVQSFAVDVTASSAVIDVARGVQLPTGLYWVRLTQAGLSSSARVVLVR